MKRLDRYMLTHFPLVWNMQLHWVLPALLALHALFFLVGLAEPQSIMRLNYSVTHFQPVAASLAVLLGLLVVIGWLVFYLRNNAFKSFYPVRNGHLLAQFFWSLLVIFLASTISITHQAGRYQRLNAITRNVDVVKEATTTGLAHHFLPFEGSQFENYNSCDSIRVRDSLAGLPFNAYNEAGPPPDRPYLNGPDTTVERSYLHYCADPPLSYAIPTSPNRFAIDSMAKRLLYGGQRQAVRATLAAYVAMVHKYGGDARLNVDAQVAEIFATPRFLVRRSSLKQYNETAGYSSGTREFINTHSVQEALAAIADVRRGVLQFDELLGFLYWALAATLLLFTFRITRLRTWFGAGIGMGIWLVIFAVLGALMGGDSYGLLTVFFLLVIGSVIFTAVNVSARRQKTASGFTFLWAVWSLPAVGLAMVYYIRRMLRGDEYRYNGQGNLIDYKPSLVAAWIDANGDLIASINFAVVLLLIALYVIPQARRWQAAPEE